jgi:DNA-binding IclR family transcriptional regulator
MDKKEQVLQALKSAGKPLRPADIAKLTGLPSKEVSQIIHLRIKERR